MLTLRLLGEIELERDGAFVALPPSRKTRALLAYLAIAPGPHRRERLCELFWDVPDDPRGALRWSLSKLRALLDYQRPRIVGDRNMVALDLADVAVDLRDARAALDTDVGALPTDRLEALAMAFRGPFVDGLDLPRCDAFNAWCLAEREAARTLHLQVLRTLLGRLDGDPARGLRHASAWVRVDPLEEAAHAALVRQLATAGRKDEAREQAERAKRALGGQGFASGGLIDEALRQAPVRAQPAAAPTPSTAFVAAPATVAPPAVPAADADPRPTIAVLPFSNLASDPGERYFSDGITQDIVTELSRFRALAVIAAQSSFALRDATDGVQRAVEEFGADYVLQGSVRRADDRIRVATNLIDATTRTSLWSERYDRQIEDIFAIQDDVTRHITASLAGRLNVVGAERARAKPAESLVAYDYVLRGLDAMDRYTAEDHRRARNMFEEALRLNPGYARALAGQAQTYIYAWFFRFDEADLEQAWELAEKALAIDPDDAGCNMVIGRACLHRRRFDDAQHYYERAIALNPNDADILASYGYLLACLGRAGEGVQAIRTAMRLNPYHRDWYYENLGNCLFARGHYDEAHAALRRVANPPAYVHGYLAACLARLGQLDEAAQAVARARAIDPNQSIERHRRGEPYARPEDLADFLEALRLAGMPETVPFTQQPPVP
jgi:TolB-like protein/DNA-binding SARP family transcriptional activator/tetratricopeptide (TPR) repeat protein